MKQVIISPASLFCCTGRPATEIPKLLSIEGAYYPLILSVVGNTWPQHLYQRGGVNDLCHSVATLERPSTVPSTVSDSDAFCRGQIYRGPSNNLNKVSDRLGFAEWESKFARAVKVYFKNTSLAYGAPPSKSVTGFSRELLRTV